MPFLAAHPPPEAPASYVQALNERPGRSARGLAPARICGDPQGETSCKGEAAGKSAQDRPGFSPHPTGLQEAGATPTCRVLKRKGKAGGGWREGKACEPDPRTDGQTDGQTC